MVTCRECGKRMVFFFYLPKHCNFCGSKNLHSYPVIEIFLLVVIAGAVIYGLTVK